MKLSEKEFWKILAKNGGLYTRTARAIEKEYGVSCSRQNVRQRAAKHPERMKQIEEANCDDAEDVLLGAFRSKKEKIRMEAVKFYLRTKGKNRGYVERWEQTGKDGKDLMQTIRVEVIDRREQVDNENTDNTDL